MLYRKNNFIFWPVELKKKKNFKVIPPIWRPCFDVVFVLEFPSTNRPVEIVWYFGLFKFQNPSFKVIPPIWRPEKYKDFSLLESGAFSSKIFRRFRYETCRIFQACFCVEFLKQILRLNKDRPEVQCNSTKMITCFDVVLILGF